MFTGIIEQMAELTATRQEGTNQRFTFRCPLANELHVDQSLAHDGICLTVVQVNPALGTYDVVAVEETLSRTTLGGIRMGSRVNVERSMRTDSRLDGHFVQGHVDSIGTVRELANREGSWVLRIGYPKAYTQLLVDKGSVAVNGVSLTVVSAYEDAFTVAIIPYTWEHTNLSDLREGGAVNLEFDVLGKYVARAMANRGSV
jgi:riboflavin synthase